VTDTDAILSAINGLEERLSMRLTRVEAHVNGLPLIGEAIAVLQRDSRMVRAAINDMARINITAGEVESMHEDIDRTMAALRELSARVATLEQENSK